MIKRFRTSRPYVNPSLFVPRIPIKQQIYSGKPMPISLHLCRYWGPRFLRASHSLVFNYLFPTMRVLTTWSFQFVRTQVLPRVFAAVAALINPSAPRFQQREVIIIIIPMVAPSTPPTIRNLATTTAPIDNHDLPLRPHDHHDPNDPPHLSSSLISQQSLDTNLRRYLM